MIWIKAFHNFSNCFCQETALEERYHKQGAIKYLYSRPKHWLDVKIKKKYDKAGRLSQKYGYFNLVTFPYAVRPKYFCKSNFHLKHQIELYCSQRCPAGDEIKRATVNKSSELSTIIYLHLHYKRTWYLNQFP